MSLIQTQGLGVRIGARQILRDVNLSVREREIVTVVGPNGSGKTTLLRVLIGAQTSSEGAVVRGSRFENWVCTAAPCDRPGYATHGSPLARFIWDKRSQ